MTVQGTISNNKGEILTDLTIATVNLSTGESYFGDTVLPDGRYSVEFDLPVNDNDALKVSKKGYQTIYVYLKDLAAMPNLILETAGNFPVLPLVLGLSAVYLLSRSEKKQVGRIEPVDIQNILLITGGVLAVSLVKQLLDKLGLGKDPGATEATDPMSAWNPTFWQQFSSYSYAITQAQAADYSKQIHDAFTIWNDDYNRIAAVFRLMKTKANVSYLAYVFNQIYGEDLLSFLGDGGGVLPWDGLSQIHLQTLIDLVHNLPKN